MTTEVPKQNPLTADFKKIPGMSVTMPSGCVLYTNEVTDVAKERGEVHIRPMGIGNEMGLKTPDLLINGDGIANMMQDCIDEVIDPRGLFSCDVNTLLVASRIVSFGHTMKVRVDNPYHDPKNEKSQKTLTYDIDLRNCLHNSKSITSIDDLNVTLDNGQVVRMTPMTFAQSVDLIKIEIESAAATLNTDAERAAFLTKKVKQIAHNALKMIIDVTTLDGQVISDRALVQDWYESIPRPLFNALKEKMDMVSALGADLSFDAHDPISGEKWTSKIPINPADFFDTGFVNATNLS